MANLYINWEEKPTAHEEACALCGDNISRGTIRLRASLNSFRVSGRASVCIKCARIPKINNR